MGKQLTNYSKWSQSQKQEESLPPFDNEVEPEKQKSEKEESTQKDVAAISNEYDGNDFEMPVEIPRNDNDNFESIKQD